MKYCTNCGRQLNDDTNFCPDCGTDNAGRLISSLAKDKNGTANNILDRNKDRTPNTDTKKKPGCLIAILVFIMILGIIILVAVLTVENRSSIVDEKKEIIGRNTEAKRVEIIVDVNEYCHLSGDELIDKMGEPDSVEVGQYSGEYNLECTWYSYGNDEILGAVEFELINDRVERFAAYNAWEYTGKDKILESFGIHREETCYLEADTGSTVRYLCPSSTVGEFSAELIEDNKFEFIRVTYDLGLYREWYKTYSNSEKAQYIDSTKEIVDSILKAPSTAEFPSLSEWNVAKNDYYVGVRSYVDAENEFGAMIRSEFSFIYDANTQMPVYIVFDGKEILNEGYIETEKLIKERIDG